MKKAFKNSILTSIVFSFLFFFTAMSYAANYEWYMNTTLGVSMKGPADWYLEMKDNPSAQANFAFKNNPFLFAIFSKYDFKNKNNWPNPLGSAILVYLFPPANASAMTIMATLYSKRSNQGLTVIERPHEIKLGNQLWVVMAFRGERQGFTLYQITYVTLFPRGSVQIEAGITDPDYNQYRKILDTFVSGIVFDTNQSNLLNNSIITGH